MNIAEEAMEKAGKALIDWFLANQKADPRVKDAIRTLLSVKTESIVYKAGPLGKLTESYPDHLQAQRLEGVDSNGHKRRLILI